MQATARFCAVAILALCMTIAFAAAQGTGPPDGVVPFNLGQREAGKTYPLTLSAENRNCPQPLDFHFTSRTSWIRLPGDSTVRQIPQGQSRDLNATLDMTNVSPGVHQGNVEVECVNCTWLIFQNCKIDKQSLWFGVNVTAPPTIGPPPPQLGPPEPSDKPGRPEARPARPDDPPGVTLPYRPLPEQRRVDDAKAAFEAAKAATLPCNPIVVSPFKQQAMRARAQANAARIKADKAEKKAQEAEAKAEASAKVLDDSKKVWDAATYDEAARGFYADQAKGKEKGLNDLHEAAKKKTRDAWASLLRDKETNAQDERAAKEARSEADRLKREADAAEQKAREAAATLKAKEDECARLRKAVEDARAELGAAQEALDEARRRSTRER